jgi:alpha-1,3-mannosyl-glycoprotein beta-1,2-N-acetylglucosaminyltransferase
VSVPPESVERTVIPGTCSCYNYTSHRSTGILHQMLSIGRFVGATPTNGNLAQRKGSTASIISPWARALQATTTGAIASGNRYHRGSHPHSGHSSNRTRLERITIASMVVIAWFWIMIFFGMMFYHGYQYRFTIGGIGTGDSKDSKKKELPLLPIQEEASKHQSENRKVIIAPVSTEQPTSSEAIGSNESPLIIFTCQRANYLQETLTDVLKYIPSDCSIGCPVVVSQDGHNTEVAQVIKDFKVKFLQEKSIRLIHIEHKRGTVRKGNKAIDPYEALAGHYGWGLRQVFDGNAVETGAFLTSRVSKTRRLPQRVIILEEDLHIAPDFFHYFLAMAPILDSDHSLLAVSAFNDNGYAGTIKDPMRVLRSDFFPGLGWMMTRKLWVDELQSKWPNAYWDDWLREPVQRENRKILRPEISRTYHFGTSGGASNNQFGSHLTKIFLNNVTVDWSAPSTPVDSQQHWSSYLPTENSYDRQYWNMIEESHMVTNIDEAIVQSKSANVRLEYNFLLEYQTVVQQLPQPLMNDEKAGILRTEYKGIVETRPHGDHFLFFTPPLSDLRQKFANILDDIKPEEQV